MAVAPSGESVLRVVTPRRHLILPRKTRLTSQGIARSIRELVDQLTKDVAASGRKSHSKEFHSYWLLTWTIVGLARTLPTPYSKTSHRRVRNSVRLGPPN